MKKHTHTVSEIKKLLLDENNTDSVHLEEWKKDPRKGVQQAISQWEKKRQAENDLRQHRDTMLEEENKLIDKGYQLVAGIDEVGRGPLAGPVVAAAVILPPDMPALWIKDSKKLSPKQRAELSEIIWEKAEVGIGVVQPDVIDKINIYEATKIAMEKALKNLPAEPDALLVDSMKLPLPLHQQSLIRGDNRSYSIAAASIVAKVYRDQLMDAHSEEYPFYGFEKNAGYGTKTHLEGLQKYGISPIHRQSFEPVKSMLTKNQEK